MITRWFIVNSSCDVLSAELQVRTGRPALGSPLPRNCTRFKVLLTCQPLREQFWGRGGDGDLCGNILLDAGSLPNERSNEQLD